MEESTADESGGTHPFENLGPEAVMDAVEAVTGDLCDGRMLPLNSYENRVWMVGLENAGWVVVKCYRPGRWPDAAIHEEHAFALELEQAGVPVVPPLSFSGATLLHAGGFRIAVFPRRGGRMLEVDDFDVLRRLGTYIARIHTVGSRCPFSDRPLLDEGDHGRTERDWLLEQQWIPLELENAYRTLTDDLFAAVDACVERAGAVSMLRLHGDFHPGNVLQTDDGFHLVDLDDARTGPAVQDLWMLLSGERDERQTCLDAVLKGYRILRPFDPRELHLIEPLRTLRLIRHAAWIARRWDDPAFPQAFPWFEEPRYWEQHLLALREQFAVLQEPPLTAPE